MGHKYYKHTITKGADLSKALSELGVEGIIVRTDAAPTGETHVYFASHKPPKHGTEVTEADVLRLG